MARYLCLTFVGVLVSSSSALIFPFTANGLRNFRTETVLAMTPREIRYKSRSEIPLKYKKNKIKKTYNSPGYEKGNFEVIVDIFKTYSIMGKMTYDILLNSKYLRFWPGRKSDIEDIWNDITENKSLEDDEEESSFIVLEQLALLLSKLDAVADQTELEMEQERLSWELDELKYNLLEDFFDSAARGRELSFTDFIVWDNIQAEIWYNNKGLSETIIADIWESIAGCVTRGVDRETFITIYKTVCGELSIIEGEISRE